MQELHVTEFITLLKKSGLLTPPQQESVLELAKSLRTPTSPPIESKAFAEILSAELVRRELITQWQGNQLLKGQTGFILQQYRLLAPVGKGGMGHVFKARDERNGAIVAIKVMSRKLTGNQTLVNRFRREIRASSLLNSPHIVRTLDGGRVGKVDFMVMEFVNGDQLDSVVARVSSIPVGIACDIVRQAAVGLQHAHEQKMVHRDIKPGNLIVDWSAEGNGTVKIMDMGLVRLGTDGDERTSVTKAGQVMGTPDYMSPEQGWDTATVDIRSDIYSLGCTFFRLLTGRVPFPGDNPLQVLMARCSKDAPSAKSLRPDIPESVDAILKKITLRDPGVRFQTPIELATALEPFCQPLTVEGLRKAMKDAGDDEAILLEMASVAEGSDQQDAGYQQFLREMDSGAAVDLMMSTNGGSEQAMATTLPIVPMADRRVGGTRRTSKSSHTAGVFALASASAIIVLVMIFMMVNRNSEDPSGNDQPNVKPPESSVTVPVAKLLPAAPITHVAGETLTYQPQFDGENPGKPDIGELRFQLGKGAPALAEIDATTGVVTWAVSAEQTVAEYDVPIELVFMHAEKSTVVASTLLVANIVAASPRYSLANAEPARLFPNKEFRWQMKATPPVEETSMLEFRLGSGQLPGMAIDAKSGEFSWTPTTDNAGRHSVQVELFDPARNHVEASASITMLVRPMFAFPKYPEQTAKAGQTFEMPLQLSERPLRLLARAIRVQVKEGSPPGVVVDLPRGILSWKVPDDATGRHEIHLALEVLLPNMEVDPDDRPEATIVVNVTAKPPAKSLVPSEADLKAADLVLRELFKRELAAAKSSADRAALGKYLLDVIGGQSAGAENFALLNIVAELAEKSRATDVGLEANRIRSERYKTPEIDVATELATNFRANSLSVAQVDDTVENLLRLALMAAVETKYEDVATLLNPPDVLLKKSERGSLAKRLAEDISRARELANELSKDSVTAADLKADELTRSLQHWQFKDLFSNMNQVSYVVSTDSGATIPDSGRSFWSVEEKRFELKARQLNASVGIVDPGQFGRFMLRMQLSSKTTGAFLILGAGQEQNLNAYVLSLDQAGFGTVTLVPSGATVVKPTTNVAIQSKAWNDVEVIVDGTQLLVRMNGVVVVTTNLADLKPGRLGLLIPLERTASPIFEMRRPRVLSLPETK